ncbi:MAG: response regulator transcription factor [Gammaproteobacteria bacterium]|nr:response regulator transcription factor [Gammaproteobacteria bacterium]
MKILIVDDEQLGRERLMQLVEKIGSPYTVVAQAASGAEAVEMCTALEIDLVLMDIRMPGINGLEAAARIMRNDPPPAVIFVTAYEEHALEAFDRNAVDYLLKPVRKERLELALGRAQALSRVQIQALDELKGNTTAYVYSSFRGGVLRIPADEVYFFRAEQKYVIARHRDGEALLEESLKTLEQQMGESFLRIHRNALAAKGWLSGLEKRPDGHFQVYFRDIDDRLEVSRRHLPEVRRWLKGG